MNLTKLLFTSLAASSLCLGAEKPNVVIIYGDDVGFGDLGAYGAKLIPTPHLDQLAKESLRFTDGHCSAATCTPSRFSMLTGIHGFRHNVRILPPNAPMKIKPEMFTLPQMFKKAGYTTAVIGKWHLGIGDGKKPVNWNGEVKPGPLEIGFDYSFLLPSTNDRVPCVYVVDHHVLNLDPKDPLYVQKNKPEGFTGTVYPDAKKDKSSMTYYQNSHGHNNSVINGIGRIGYMWGGKAALWNDETMTDVFVDQTKKYLAKFKDNNEQPFFLYFASQCIHVPRAPSPRFKGKSKLSYRGDAMVEFDWASGEIVKALEENGLTDNTIVIFSSDNGPVYDDGYDDDTTVRTSTKEVDNGHDGSGPYRGGKYQIYEGGTRVPFMIKWPAKIKPGTSSALVSQIDFVASFAALVGVNLTDDQAIDSRNMLNTFLGKEDKGLPYMVEEAGILALRQGPWKYIQGRNKKGKKGKKAAQALGKLFNLDSDVGEQMNIIKEQPERAKLMEEQLNKVKQAKAGIRSL